MSGIDGQCIRDWLDSHNNKLLAEVESTIPVKFTLWDNDYYASQIHKNEKGEHCEAEVFYKEPLSQAKFAHELLHVKTGLAFGDNGIMFAVEQQTVPFQLFMQNAHNILNVCEHNMFFPDYLEMGYKEEDSFEESKDLEKRFEELDSLAKTKLKKGGHYIIERVFSYLGLVFSFLFYPNNERFKKQVKQLRKIDVPLFSRIQKLKNNCMDLDITPDNKDFVQNSYYSFAMEINEWFAKAFKGAVFQESDNKDE